MGTIVKITFNAEDGAISYLKFPKATAEEIQIVWGDYNTEYYKREYIGSFEDYLRLKEIEFEYFNFDLELVDY